MAPVQALADAPPATGAVRRWRLVTGVPMMAAGAALLPVAVATWRGPLLFPAAALTLAGVRLVGPSLAGPLARTVGLPVARALGVPGALGRHNATRSPERTAATASAVMIGLALVTLVNVLFASTQAPLLADLDRDHADFQVWQAAADRKNGRAEPMDPAVVARLRALPELAAVVTVDCVGDPAGGGRVCAADPAELSKVVDLVVRDGSLADLATGGVGLDEEAAADAGVRVGSTLRLGTASLPVTAVYRRTTNFSGYLLGPAAFARLGGEPAPSTVLIRVAGGVRTGAARAAVVAEVAGYPRIEVHDRAEFHRRDLHQIRSAAAVYRTLTGLAALVGLFGVTSTIALSIVERRRELALLRAVGMQRRQVGAMVRAEAVIVTLVGTALGLTAGVLFGWAAARVLEHSSQPTTFTMPYASLALTVAVMAAAGVLAATVPARLAGRVDVLPALAAD